MITKIFLTSITVNVEKCNKIQDTLLKNFFEFFKDMLHGVIESNCLKSFLTTE